MFLLDNSNRTGKCLDFQVDELLARGVSVTVYNGQVSDKKQSLLEIPSGPFPTKKSLVFLHLGLESVDGCFVFTYHQISAVQIFNFQKKKMREQIVK